MCYSYNPQSDRYNPTAVFMEVDWQIIYETLFGCQWLLNEYYYNSMQMP